MIEKAIEKILELAIPNTLTINGSAFCDKKLIRMDEEQRAAAIDMNTLTSLVQYVKKNNDEFKACKYIVQVESPTKVRLLSALDKDRKREILVEVTAEVPGFSFGRFLDHEEFLIGVQSKFVDDDAADNDKPLILKFAGTVKGGTVKEYGDDGVSQKATVKTGVASLSEAVVPSPCRLMPYRTFAEVKQPMSNFIFRMKEDSRGSDNVQCALFEADGGAWKNEAQANIREYLETELRDFENVTVIS